MYSLIYIYIYISVFNADFLAWGTLGREGGRVREGQDNLRNRRVVWVSSYMDK